MIIIRLIPIQRFPVECTGPIHSTPTPSQASITASNFSLTTLCIPSIHRPVTFEQEPAVYETKLSIERPVSFHPQDNALSTHVRRHIVHTGTPGRKSGDRVTSYLNLGQRLKIRKQDSCTLMLLLLGF